MSRQRWRVFITASFFLLNEVQLEDQLFVAETRRIVMSFRVKESFQKVRPEGLHADCAKVRILQAPTADTLVTVQTNGVSEVTRSEPADPGRTREVGGRLFHSFMEMVRLYRSGCR